MSTLGQETLNTPAYVQVDAHHCHVMTDVMSRYALIGEPSLAGKAVKILRVAAFVPVTSTSSDYEIRVYFMEDTTDALEVRIGSYQVMVDAIIVNILVKILGRTKVWDKVASQIKFSKKQL